MSRCCVSLPSGPGQAGGLKLTGTAGSKIVYVRPRMVKGLVMLRRAQRVASVMSVRPAGGGR